MSSSSCICPHLHLPLQSGCDTVLERMGRRYSAGFFRDLTARATTALPDAFIGADLIAGFPGESEAEFKETLKLLEQLQLSDLHVFPYSSRPGTKAAGMPGQLPGQIIKERAAILRKVADLKKLEFMERFIGREMEVLVQGYNRKTSECNGLTSNYLSVRFAGNPEMINRLLTVRLLGCNGEYCSGEAVFQGL